MAREQETIMPLDLPESDDGEEANEALRQLIAEGEASGEPEPYDMASIQASLDRERSGRA